MNGERAPAESETGAEAIDVAVLLVGGEQLGVEITQVIEIRPLKQIAYLPGVSPAWPGLVNLRGNLYPVLDLQFCLDILSHNVTAGRRPRDPEAACQMIVLVSVNGLALGLRVDDVPEIRSVPRANIGPPLERDSSQLGLAAIQGITSDFVGILDLPALVAAAERLLDDNARART